MGNKVNVAFINAKIRLADAKFGNQKDKKLTADETEAIEFFKNEIEKAKSYISDETYNAALKEIMGFEPSASSSEEPAKASTTENVEKKASVTSPYKRTAVADSEPVTFETNKKGKFKLPDDGLSSRKGEEKEFLKRLNSYASIEGLVANLSNDVTNSKYDNVKKVAFFFANEIQKMDIKTEADIKTIKSKIKSKCKNCNGYNADILNAMVKIAEKELIEKETSELAGKYHKVKMGSKEIHFSNYEKGVEDATKDKEYHPKSRKRLKSIMEAEANTYVDKYHRNTDGKTSRTSAYKTKSVRKQIQARVPEDDKFLRDVIKKDKVDNRLEGRYNKYNDITEKIKDISYNDLNKSLDNTVLTKLGVKYLATTENKNGNYNLTELQAEVKKYVGYDLKLNRTQDIEKSELEHTQYMLKELTGSDFSKSEIKNLVEFLGIEFEGRDRSLPTVLDATIAGALVGALAAASASDDEHLTQTMELNLVSKESLDALLAKLGDKAIDYKQDNKGTYTIRLFQEMITEEFWADVAKGATIGALVQGLTTLVVGKDRPFEKSCLSDSYITDILNQYDDINIIKEKIQNKYPGAKGILYAGLAHKHYEADKQNWKIQYLATLSNGGGVGSNFNCEEGAGMKFNKETRFIPKKEAKAEEHTYNIKDESNTVIIEENAPAIDGGRTTWGKIAEQYDCLDEVAIPSNYKNCQRRKGELPARMVKVAQAITDGNYSMERLLELAELTFASPTKYYHNLKDYKGIDHDTLVRIMNATYLPNREYDKDGNYIPGTGVKVPQFLGGCERNESLSLKVAKQPPAPKDEAAGKHAQGKYSSTEYKYYARFDGGKWIPYSSMKERDNAITDFKKKYPDATVEKKNED